MKDLKYTKKRVALIYSIFFLVVFGILGISFFSFKYFSNTNDYVLETKIKEFQKTGYGDEIDSIFKVLDDNNKQNTVKKKIYPLENYQKDLFVFIIFILIISGIFFIFSSKIISKMIKPVEENIEDMKNFIDNAGHELKTPLATIDSSLWLMKEKGSFDKNLIEKSQKDIFRANKLIENLRDFSNIKSTSEKEIFFVFGEINEILQNYEKNIKSKNINLEIDLIQDFELEANKSYFDILISNIISNAIKYNNESGSIKITISNKNIIIEDTGIGIPKDKIPKIFDRFYRVKSHRDKEGFGLGLSIVKKILEIYNWKIEIISEEEMGTKVIIKI